MSRGPGFARARRVIAAATITALLPIALLGSPVAAANNTIVVGYIGDCGFYGEFSGNRKSVQVTWRDSDGALKAKFKVTSLADGSWSSPCEFNELVEPGDTIQTKIGTGSGNTRTATVPRLTINADRVQNVVSGYGPDSSAVGLFAAVYGGTFNVVATAIAEPVPTDGTGWYSHDFDTSSATADPADLRGFDYVEVFRYDNQGNYFARAIDVEAVAIYVGKPHVDIVGDPRTRVSVDLTDGIITTAELYAEADDRLDLWGQAQSEFLSDDGDPVRPQAGQFVDADFASDAFWQIDPISLSVNKSTDKVTLDCGSGEDGALVEVVTRSGGSYKSRRGVTSEAGVYVANFANTTQGGKRDIKPGDKVIGSCKLEGIGDIVRRQITVP